MTTRGTKKPSGKGFWPNPETEAFRRPVRSLHKDHLHPSGERNPYLLENQDISVSHFLKKGKPVYFINEEEASPYFKVPECTSFSYKNHFDLLNIINDTNDVNVINDFNDINDVIDTNYVNVINDFKDINDVNYVKMWRVKVPECTHPSYGNNPHKPVYKNNKKYLPRVPM